MSRTNHSQKNKEDVEKSMIMKIAQEFGEMSLMHGIRFIVNRKATIAERLGLGNILISLMGSCHQIF